MAFVTAHRQRIGFAAALALPVGVAAALIPFRGNFADTASALVLVAVVVAVATFGDRLAGMAAAAVASLSFDFFLTRPYERFAITHGRDIETTVSLFLVGVAVTELAQRNRHHRRIADEEGDFVGMIYYLSELVAGGATSEQVVAQASSELTDLLHLRSCRFESGVRTGSAARIERDGDVAVGDVGWEAQRMGLPGPEVDLLVRSGGHELGRFVLEPTPGWPVALQRRVVAAAIADQVGAAVSPRWRTA